MTGPGIRAAVAALDDVIKAAMLARSALLSETSERFDAASAAEVAEGVDDEAARVQEMYDAPLRSLQFCAVHHHADGGLCTRLWGHDGDHASRGTHTRWPQAAHLGPAAGHQLHSISIPSGDVA